MLMEVKFWGTRGSIATPSVYGETPEDSFITAKYGGNTSCVEVRNGKDLIILDAGTGLRFLGIDLIKRGFNPGKNPLHLFLSHYHADHIEGLGFFKQVFNPNAAMTIYGQNHGYISVQNAVSRRQDHPYFPLQIDKWPAKIKFIELEDGQKLKIGNANIEVATVDHLEEEHLEELPELDVGMMNHPNGGSSTYRIELDGNVFVYATDVEVNSSQETREKLLRMSNNADLLVIDSQYTSEEYETRKGWGHNDYKTAIDIGIEAKVKKMRLHHHEPEHDDKMLDELERLCKEYAMSKADGLDIMLARERMTIVL